jgi:hypothetical protein
MPVRHEQLLVVRTCSRQRWRLLPQPVMRNNYHPVFEKLSPKLNPTNPTFLAKTADVTLVADGRLPKSPDIDPTFSTWTPDKWSVDTQDPQYPNSVGRGE